MFQKMPFIPLILTLTVLATASGSTISKEKPTPNTPANKPNVVIFYVDDLGWGDLSAYGATRVKTPNVDALAQNGIRFTDGHASAATCTPSRYSLLTGEHAFRKGIHVLKGDDPMIIATDQATLPKMLKKAGYTTGVVGKWHLGLGDGRQPIDWNSAVKPGPLEIGFDYSYLIPATGDRVPTVYLNGHYVENLEKNDPLYVNYDKKIGTRPTGYENPTLMRQKADRQHDKTIVNGISRIGWMQGGKKAEWVDEEFHTVTTQRANAFIDNNVNKPFFLFFSFHDIHVPRLPNKMFQGKTSMGVRGDAIVQMDWITGQVVDHLKKRKLLENTIVIFTSDNGAVLTDGYHDKALTLIGDHQQNGIFRGGKYSAYEAGTRIPFIVHYPAKTRPGVSDALVSQIDIYASIAKLTGVKLSPKEAIDSQDTLTAFLDPTQTARQELIEESTVLSIRDGQWKYIRPAKVHKPWIQKKKNIEPGTEKFPQLFNLSIDPREQNNLANTHPELVAKLETKIQQIQARKTRE